MYVIDEHWRISLDEYITWPASGRRTISFLWCGLPNESAAAARCRPAESRLERRGSQAGEVDLYSRDKYGQDEDEH